MRWSDRHECWIIVSPECANCGSPKAQIPDDQIVGDWMNPREFYFHVTCVR